MIRPLPRSRPKSLQPSSGAAPDWLVTAGGIENEPWEDGAGSLRRGRLSLIAALRLPQRFCLSLEQRKPEMQQLHRCFDDWRGLPNSFLNRGRGTFLIASLGVPSLAGVFSRA